MLARSAAVRVAEDGWVLMNSGGAEPPAEAIFSHSVIAAFGL